MATDSPLLAHDPSAEPDPLARQALALALQEAVDDDSPRFLSELIASEIAERGALPPESIEALALAARLGRAECLRLLLPFCDPTARESGQGDTPLRAAARAGQAECLELLLPVSQADPEDSYCPEAMHLAATAGHLDCVLALIPHCDPGRVCPWREEPPAVSALLSGHPECFLALAPFTDLAALPSLDEGWNRDLLMLCATEQLAHCLPAALPFCDLARRDKRGFSALTWAAMNGSLKATEFLLPLFDPREATLKGVLPAAIAERHADGLVAAALREKAARLDEGDAIAASAQSGSHAPAKPRL